MVNEYEEGADDVNSLDLRIGTIREAALFAEAADFTIRLLIDFGGEVGLRTSRSQVKQRREPEEWIGRQVIGIMNAPPRREAGCQSDVFVLGEIQEIGDVVLLKPDRSFRIESGLE